MVDIGIDLCFSIDFTTSTPPELLEAGEIPAAKAVAMATNTRTVLDLAAPGVTDATELRHRTEVSKAMERHGQRSGHCSR